MKNITSQINQILNDQQFSLSIENYKGNPKSVHGDVNITEALDKYEYCKEIIINSILNGSFDDISFVRRNAILSNFNSLNQNRNNPTNAINQIESLYDNLTISGLLYKQIAKTDLETEVKQLIRTRKAYEKLNFQIKDSEKLHESIINHLKEIEKIKISANEMNMEIDASLQIVNEVHEEIVKTSVNSNELLDKIKVNEAEVEKRKMSISTFSENIEEYKKQIDLLIYRSEEILKKDSIISNLIKDAENALRLKSAQGISAAFSYQYEIANNKRIYKYWLLSAATLILIALILTSWIVGGWFINDPSEISSMIGRIVAVGIAITGATFCANQYIRQKNIAEDYAYKATLSKSIIAFSEEIKKRCDGQVSEYLIKVLEEIHKDPLRKRNEQKETGITDKTLEMCEKIFNLVNKQ